MRRILSLALAPLLALAGPARGDAYGDAMAAARREASTGRWSEAARLLEEPARTWPQDYPVQLERAWCLFQAGAWVDAAAAYRRAQALEPEAVDPVLGLAWTAQRLDQPAEARQLFAEVLRREPGSASGREGAALVGRAHRAWLSLGGAYTGYQGETSKSWLAGGAVAADARLADRLTLGALYRFVGSQAAFGGGGSRGRGGGTSADPQQEVHGSLGWSQSSFDLALHGGWVGESSTTTAARTTTWVERGLLAGASAGLRPGAGLELETSALRTFYASGDVTQLQATAGLGLGRGLMIRGGARAQLAAPGNRLAGLASLELRGPWSAWLAAELGNQRRPVDLLARAIYAVPEELRWAARAGLGFPVAGPLSGRAALDLESWRASTATGSADSTAWRGSAGLLLAF